MHPMHSTSTMRAMRIRPSMQMTLGALCRALADPLVGTIRRLDGLVPSSLRPSGTSGAVQDPPETAVGTFAQGFRLEWLSFPQDKNVNARWQRLLLSRPDFDPHHAMPFSTSICPVTAAAMSAARRSLSRTMVRSVAERSASILPVSAAMWATMARCL